MMALYSVNTRSKSKNRRRNGKIKGALRSKHKPSLVSQLKKRYVSRKLTLIQLLLSRREMKDKIVRPLTLSEKAVKIITAIELIHWKNSSELCQLTPNFQFLAIEEPLWSLMKYYKLPNLRNYVFLKSLTTTLMVSQTRERVLFNRAFHPHYLTRQEGDQ